MPVNPKALSYEGIKLTQSDFVDGDDAGTTIQPGQVGELFVAEIGEDGQLSGYDAIRLGDRTADNDPARGKMFMDITDDTGTSLPDDTMIRFRFRDKNYNRQPPASQWYALRDLDQSDPRLRRALPPRERNGRPWFVAEGRLLVIEAKNESQSITLGDTSDAMTVEAPARAGY